MSCCSVRSFEVMFKMSVVSHKYLGSLSIETLNIFTVNHDLCYDVPDEMVFLRLFSYKRVSNIDALHFGLDKFTEGA
jgi:hypothetical protein